jgi:putative endonuclease
MRRNQTLGRRGEVLAADFLAGLGMTVLERNWRCRAGELDIVADDAGTVVGVEVKTRSGLGYGHPAEAIGRAKLRRLFVLTGEWCKANGRAVRHSRVDVVSVLLLPGAPVAIEHYVEVGP